MGYARGGSLVVAVVCAMWARGAEAGFIVGSGSGEFEVFDDVSQMAPLMGTASFDEGPLAGPIALDTYAAQGMLFATGPLTQILPGSIVDGVATAPHYGVDDGSMFPPPFYGGGVQEGQIARGGAVVTFTEKVTQIGLVAAGTEELHLSAWDATGEVIVELVWVPSGSPGFLGLDTRGRPITMFAVGNDQLDGSETDGYTPAVGSAIATDTWMWSRGFLCEVDADCDDASVCSGSEACVDGYCAPGLGLDCESEDACQIDWCDPVDGCMHAPINNCCTDEADCPEGQVCKFGACALPPDPTGDPETSGEASGESGTSGEATSDPILETTGGVESTGAVEPTTTTSGSSGEVEGTGSDGGGEAGEGTSTATPTSGAGGEAGETSGGGDAGEVIADGGCGCATSEAPAGLLVGLLGLLRRRARASGRR